MGSSSGRAIEDVANDEAVISTPTNHRVSELRDDEKKRAEVWKKTNTVDVGDVPATMSGEIEQDVFGDESGNEIRYQTMVWWKVAILMIAETVSLGILSIPRVFSVVGMPAGVILVLALGAIATVTGYYIGQFKLRYPQVHTMYDAGRILGGTIGSEILGLAQVTFLLFVCAGHVLTGAIAFDTITNSASCSMLWAGMTGLICLLLTIPRTLDKISYLSILSFISIVAAVFIAMVGVGVAGRTDPVKATSTASFYEAFLGVANITVAYAGHAAFFGFISEMKDPRDFSKALYTLQITDTALYLIVGIVVYYYVGDNAVSPALGNTGVTLQRVAYGVALPTIVIAGVINGHVLAKLIFVRIFRRKDGALSRHLSSNTYLGWGVWLGICVAIWALSFVIAELIPFFSDLLGLLSALFASWFTYGLSGVFALHLIPRSRWFGSKWMAVKTVFQMFTIVMGAVIMGCGLYASITSIMAGYASGVFGSPFSCVSKAA